VTPRVPLVDLRHLQLPPAVTNHLHASALASVGDVLAFAASSDIERCRFQVIVEGAIERIEASTAEGRIDWRVYWKLSGMKFYFLCADLPQLTYISDQVARFPVDRATFGNAGAQLARAGYTNVSQLFQALPHGIFEVSGIGELKVSEFFKSLTNLVDRLDESGNVRIRESIAGPRDYFTDRIVAESLSLQVRALPIGVLHLGTKQRTCEEHGFTTVGQLADAWVSGSLEMKSIGGKTIDKIREGLCALSISTRDAGIVDWTAFSKCTGYAMIPAQAAPNNGTQLLEGLSGIVEAIADSLDDRIDADILIQRIVRLPKDRKTLDDIAGDHRLSRERVRQRESALLSQIADALIWENYGSLQLHFRPEYSSFWKRAAAQFGDAEEIGFVEFLNGLCEAWQVDRVVLIAHLPVILAIVTGDPHVPADFRTGYRIENALFGQFSSNTRQVSLRKLRLGRHARTLVEAGVLTIGEFVDRCLDGTLRDTKVVSVGEAMAHMSVVGDSLTSSGDIDWSRYREKLVLERNPSRPPRTPTEFLSGLESAISRILIAAAVTMRSVEIFKLRVSRKGSERPTLRRVAEQLKTHQPTIKLEESKLLHFLNELVVGGNYAVSPVWLDEEWIRFWRHASAVFSSAHGDYRTFDRLLSSAWSLPELLRSNTFPMVWAILSGYPSRKSSESHPARALPSRFTVSAPDRVRLRGFLRPH
jgi:hypothetical protein